MVPGEGNFPGSAQRVPNSPVFPQAGRMDQVLSVSLCFPPRTKALVLELLAAVCLVRGGHEIILSAFDNFKEVGGAASAKFGCPCFS